MKINLDDGFSFGEGVFETIKIVNGKALFLDEHIDRLNSSLKFFNIYKEISSKEVLEYLKDAEKNCALKIMVSKENTIFTTRKDPYISVDRKKEYSLTISKVLRNSTSSLVYHKTLNYYENILENRKAKSAGFDEVIFLNEEGYVCEGSVSNIFFIKDNKIYTPDVKCGLLNGIIRKVIMKKFEVVETLIKKEELATFKSAFITNSLMEVRLVKNIDEIEFKDSKLIEEIIEKLR